MIAGLRRPDGSLWVPAAGLFAGLLAILGAQVSPLVPLAAIAGAALVTFALLRPFAAICLALLTIPFETFSVSTGNAVLQPAKVIGITAAACWLIRRIAGFDKDALALRTPLTLPLAAVLAAHLPGLFVADNRLAVAKELVVWGSWFVLFCAVVSERRPEATRVLTIVIALSGGIVAAIAVAKTAGSTQTAYQAAGQVTNRAEGSFTSPVALGIFLTVILPLQLVLIGRDQARWVRLLGLVAATLSILALVLSLTRGALLAATIAVLWLVLAWRPARKPAAVIACLLLVMLLTRFNPVPGLVNTNVVLQRLTSINTQTFTAQLRLEIWHIVPKMVEHNLPFGIGAKNFPNQAPSYGLVFPAGPPSNAHDLLFDVATELGIPGLLAFAWLLGAIVVSLNRGLRRLTGADWRLAVALSATVLAILVDGVTDYSYNEDSFALTVVLLLALLARLTRAAHPPVVTPMNAPPEHDVATLIAA